jgi:hypothetical protein
VSDRNLDFPCLHFPAIVTRLHVVFNSLSLPLSKVYMQSPTLPHRCGAVRDACCSQQHSGRTATARSNGCLSGLA